MSENPDNLESFVRTIGVLGPHPGSKGSRPASWWRTVFEDVLGRELTLGQVRRAMRLATVTFVKDGESSNLLVRESLRRAAQMYPSHFRFDTDRDRLERLDSPHTSGIGANDGTRRAG